MIWEPMKDQTKLLALRYLHDVVGQQEDGTTKLSGNTDYICCIQPFLINCMFTKRIQQKILSYISKENH